MSVHIPRLADRSVANMQAVSLALLIFFVLLVSSGCENQMYRERPTIRSVARVVRLWKARRPRDEFLTAYGKRRCEWGTFEYLETLLFCDVITFDMTCDEIINILGPPNITADVVEPTGKGKGRLWVKKCEWYGYDMEAKWASVEIKFDLDGRLLSMLRVGFDGYGDELEVRSFMNATWDIPDVELYNIQHHFNKLSKRAKTK